MGSKLIIVSVAILLILGGIILYQQQAKINYLSKMPLATSAPTSAPVSFDFGNQQIMLDNQTITLTNGSYQNSDSTQSANISSSSVSASGTRGLAILVDNPGGSGTFYYLVGGMTINGKAIYSTPVLLGDRIKIVSANVDDPQAEDNGEITVQYLDRGATTPTTKKFAFQDDGNLIAVLH